MARYTEATLRFKETKLGGRGRGQKKTETRKRSRLTIRERGEGRRGGEGDLVDSVVVQVQPCCKGKISCRRFVDNGVMAEVCLDASSLMRRAYNIHKKKLVPQVATRWKEERKSNERPLQAGQMSREKDSRGIERSLSSKKCDAKGAADSRKCRGKIYCEFNALTLKERRGVIVLAQPKYRCKNILLQGIKVR